VTTVDDALRLVTAATWVFGIAALVLSVAALLAALALLRAAWCRLRHGGCRARIRALEHDLQQTGMQLALSSPRRGPNDDTLTLPRIEATA
jgi:hypothetical protein